MTDNIYDDLLGTDLGENIAKLEKTNKSLEVHIVKLETDIARLCAEMTDMKKVQVNLSRNISELFKTAKAEIARKDRMIADLRRERDDLLFRRQDKDRIVNATKRQRNDSDSDCVQKRQKTLNENKTNSDDSLSSRARRDTHRQTGRRSRSRSRTRTSGKEPRRNASRNRYPQSTSNRYGSKDRRRRSRSRSKVSRSSKEKLVKTEVIIEDEKKIESSNVKSETNLQPNAETNGDNVEVPPRVNNFSGIIAIMREESSKLGDESKPSTSNGNLVVNAVAIPGGFGRVGTGCSGDVTPSSDNSLTTSGGKKTVRRRRCVVQITD